MIQHHGVEGMAYTDTDTSMNVWYEHWQWQWWIWREVSKKLVLPKSTLPVRPFLIRYMAQDRGPELENAPVFMFLSWLWKQRQLGPSIK